jgi:hypothetical protein
LATLPKKSIRWQPCRVLFNSGTYAQLQVKVAKVAKLFEFSHFNGRGFAGRPVQCKVAQGGQLFRFGQDAPAGPSQG